MNQPRHEKEKTEGASIKLTPEERRVFEEAAGKSRIGMTTFLKIAGFYAADHLERTGSLPICYVATEPPSSEEIERKYEAGAEKPSAQAKRHA